MKKLKLILGLFMTSIILSSCIHYHTNEHIIVVGVEMSSVNTYKYKVELEFLFSNQILYTDSLYHVGDTIK